MKEPKVKMKDRAKFPKVQDEYEKRFKKSYNHQLEATMLQVKDILTQKI